MPSITKDMISAPLSAEHGNAVVGRARFRPVVRTTHRILWIFKKTTTRRLAF